LAAIAGGATIPRKNLGESLGFSFVSELVFYDFRNIRYVGVGIASETEFGGNVSLRREYTDALSRIPYEVHKRKKIGVSAEKDHFVVLGNQHYRVYRQFDVQVSFFDRMLFAKLVDQHVSIFIAEKDSFKGFLPDAKFQTFFQIRPEAVNSVEIIPGSAGSFFWIREIYLPDSDFATESFRKVCDEFFEIDNRLSCLVG
jgi:hypothetical protein